MFISIVCPVYKTKSSLEELVDRVFRVVDTLNVDWELILVDDACPENSWELIKVLSSKFDQVKGLRMPYNHGQHRAIRAGLEMARGEWVVVMDADLQDQPEYIPSLLKAAQLQGVDYAVASWAERYANKAERQSLLFYKLLNLVSQYHFDATVGNFGVYRRYVIQHAINVAYPFWHFPLVIAASKYQGYQLKTKRIERSHGRSSYQSWKKAKLAFEILITYSYTSIKFSIKIIFLMIIISIIITILL